MSMFYYNFADTFQSTPSPEIAVAALVAFFGALALVVRRASV